MLPLLALIDPRWTLVLLVPLLATAVVWAWPGSPLTVLYDGDCGMCRRTFALLERFDWTRSIEGLSVREWAAVEARFPQLDEASCLRDMCSVDGRGVASFGFASYQRIAWRLPLIAPLAWLLYLPPIAPIGRRIYRRIADSRQISGCGSGAGEGEGGCPLK